MFPEDSLVASELPSDLQPSHSCLLPANKTTVLAGSQAVAFSQDVLALVPCVQLGVCEPMAIPMCPKWSRAPGHMQIDFACRCRDIDLSCCLFQGKFYICTTCVMPSRFRGKGLQDGKAGSARHPRASLPSVKSCLRHSRAGSQPRQQLRYRDEECDLIVLYSGNRCLPWKWSSFPSLN